MGKIPALLLLLSLFTAHAEAQWSIGAGAGVAYWPPARPFGAAQGAYRLNSRISATLHLSALVPNPAHNSGFHPSAPRLLATGDTASYTYDYDTHATSATALLGLRGLLRPPGKGRNWYWACAAGYGLEHQRMNGTTTYTYGGATLQFDDHEVRHFMLASISAGAIWRLKKIDLLAGITGTGWFRPFGRNFHTTPLLAHFRPALELMALWHWGH